MHVYNDFIMVLITTLMGNLKYSEFIMLQSPLAGAERAIGFGYGGGGGGASPIPMHSHSTTNEIDDVSLHIASCV